MERQAKTTSKRRCFPLPSPKIHQDPMLWDEILTKDPGLGTWPLCTPLRCWQYVPQGSSDVWERRRRPTGAGARACWDAVPQPDCRPRLPRGPAWLRGCRAWSPPGSCQHLSLSADPAGPKHSRRHRRRFREFESRGHGGGDARSRGAPADWLRLRRRRGAELRGGRGRAARWAVACG